MYHRASLSVAFDGDAAALAPVFVLVDESGLEIPMNTSFSSDGFKAVLAPSAPLAPSTTHTLTASVCEAATSASFTTSAFGEPLGLPPEDLAGSTWVFDLTEADYAQPPGLGLVLAAFLTEPILVGFGQVAGGVAEVRGAQGVWVGDSATTDSALPVWDLGEATLDGPYFASEPADVVLDYGCAQIALDDFFVEGTVSSDGTEVGGARAVGLADTSQMGCLVPGGGGNPDAICSVAAGFGLTCEACDDGSQRCLTIEALFAPAPLTADLSL